MIVLTKKEAEVYEAYLQHGSVRGLSKEIGTSQNAAYKQRDSLVRKGMLEKGMHGHYKVITKEYTIKTNKEKVKESKKLTIRKPPNNLPPDVTQDIQDYIRGHYGKLPRRKLAERTGLSKLVVNMTILALGLSKERMEDDARHAKSDESCSA